MPGVGVYIQSTDTASNQNMTVFAHSDSKGKFSFQSFKNYLLAFTLEGGDKCLQKGSLAGTLTATEKVIDITVPAERKINLNVETQSGIPISDVEVNMMGRTFDLGYSCGGQQSAHTDNLGNITLSTFVGPGLNPGSYPGAVAVRYSPFENVQLIKWLSEAEITTNQVAVTLEDVPSLEFSAPTVAKVSGFDVSAKVLNPDGSVAINQARVTPGDFQTASVRLQFRQVDLFKRVFVKGKWGSWLKQSRVSVGSNGVAKFSKLKFAKGSYQIRVSGVGFTVGCKTKSLAIR